MTQRVKIFVCATLLLGAVSGGRYHAGQQPNGVLNVAPPPDPVEEPTVEADPVTFGRDIVDISVNEPRAMGAVVRALQFKLGELVSYEDVELVHPDDLVSAREVFVSPRGPDRLYPAARALRLLFDVDPTSRQPLDSVAGILEGLLAQYNDGSDSTEFKLVELGEGSGFSIVPSKVRDIDGSIVDARTPFDFRISFPEEQRTSEENVDAIVSAVAAASGARITIFNYLPLRSVSLGAENEVARVVLTRLLREAYDWKANWHLNYGPAEGYWGLNFGAVYIETGEITSFGGPEIRQVPWPGRSRFGPAPVPGHALGQ